MDIERLKELKNVVVLNSWLSERAKEEIMKRFTKLLRIEYEDKWVVEDAFEDESGLIRGKAIDCLAQYETANEGLGCEECFGVAGMEIPLSTGIKSVNFCPICGRRF